MDLILANAIGEEIKIIRYPVFDCDCNGNRTFSLSVPVSEWDGSIGFGSRLFVPGEEYGGVVGQITTDTELGLVTVSGHTWRGLLAQKVIQPREGLAYLTVSGSVTDIMINDLKIGNRFGNAIIPRLESYDAETGTYQFNRYCTLLDGLNDMLSAVNSRIELHYDDDIGAMALTAASIVDYSPDIELSQNYELKFTYDDIRNQPNHLIVGGKGELTDREILHLYLDKNGKVGTEQYYFGLNEIEAFWENTSTDQLEKDSIKHFNEIKNSAKLSMDINAVPDTARIGDLVGGRDYITGQSMTAPIGNIVLQMNGDIVTKNYTLEETEK